MTSLGIFLITLVHSPTSPTVTRILKQTNNCPTIHSLGTLAAVAYLQSGLRYVKDSSN